MSNRVQEQQQQQQRMETERMQKAADKAARQQSTDQADRQQFGQLMKNSAQETKHKTVDRSQQKDAEKHTKKQGKAKKGDGKAKTETQDRTARLARGGALHQSKVMAQAESFHSMLDSKKTETEGMGQVLAKEADESRTETAGAAQDRTGDLQQHAEERRETSKAEARLQSAKADKHNAAISGDKPAGDEQDGGEGHGDEAGVDAAKKAAGKNEVAEASVQGAAGAKQLPPEVIEALVKQVMVGVTPDGIATFRIELNDGVLQGATLQITAEKGKVGIDVAGLDPNAKRLVQASVGQLQRGLEKRGLQLDWLAVA